MRCSMKLRVQNYFYLLKSELDLTSIYGLYMGSLFLFCTNAYAAVIMPCIKESVAYVKLT